MCCSAAPQAPANRPTDARDGVRQRRSADVFSDHGFLVARQACWNIEGFVRSFSDHAPDFVAFLDHVHDLKA
jgi:hypothetical protein